MFRALEFEDSCQPEFAAQVSLVPFHTCDPSVGLAYDFALSEPAVWLIDDRVHLMEPAVFRKPTAFEKTSG